MVAQFNFDDAAPLHLSPRERETLERLLKGCSEKQIALALSISKHTVHIYVKQLYRRFGVNSRSELLALWIAAISQTPLPNMVMPGNLGEITDVSDLLKKRLRLSLVLSMLDQRLAELDDDFRELSKLRRLQRADSHRSPFP